MVKLLLVIILAAYFVVSASGFRLVREASIVIMHLQS